MRLHNQEPVSFEDVKDEIFDMVKPDHPLKITLADLTRSGQGDTVISILTDLNGFWSYENREVLVVDSGENEDSWQDEELVIWASGLIIFEEWVKSKRRFPNCSETESKHPELLQIKQNLS